MTTQTCDTDNDLILFMYLFYEVQTFYTGCIFNTNVSHKGELTEKPVSCAENQFQMSCRLEITHLTD